MSVKLNKAQTALMIAIVTATLSEQGFAYAAEKDTAALVKANYVELNRDVANDAGEIATRATEAGIAAFGPNADAQGAGEAGNGAATETAPKQKQSFAIANNVPIPAASRVGRKPESYPFADLEIGGSFFIPATVERPEPHKTLASSITAANNRYSEVVEGETRETRKGNVVPVTKPLRNFIMRPVEDGAPWGFAGQKGAAVWRTALAK